jgi:hypothetical protein
MNRKNLHKSSHIFYEFPTIYFNGIDNLIATARYSKVATTLAIQNFSQLKVHYGKEQAEVILNIVGNVISGQVAGETAKQLSERFGKIMQDRGVFLLTGKTHPSADPSNWNWPSRNPKYPSFLPGNL